MKLCIILNNVTLTKGGTSSTLIEWLAILINCLVVVTCFIWNATFVSIFINTNHTSTMTCTSITCDKNNPGIK